MHLLVIGASRGVGRKCVDEALSRGHHVAGLSRSDGNLPVSEDRFEPVRGDATDPETLSAALPGKDAVLLTLGIKERISMIWQEERLFSDATRALIPAMEAAGVRRLVCLTGLGTAESRSAFSAIERAGFGFFLGRAYEDKARQEALIAESELDWTIVRPTILTNNAKSRDYKVLTDPKTWRNGVISRASVADFMVGVAEGDDYVRQRVVITR